MKCRDCGQEGFNSPNEITKHKRTDCPANTAPKVDLSQYNPVVKGVQIEMSKETHDFIGEDNPSLDDLYALASQLGVGVIVVKDSKHLVIPRRFLPDETKYLGTNSYMGVKVRGYLQDDGLMVQEQVEFLR